MATVLEDIQQKVIKIVQELLSDVADKSAITPTLINEKIELVVSLNPRWGADLDRAAARDELIRRFSIWIGQHVILKNDVGHVSWLTAARKRDWRYWQRYSEWQERKIAVSAVQKLDESTDAVLELLEDPMRDGPWDRRGLVVGHVQSGKTSHYSGLICKSADAGYKIIIVLAGMHNNLRSQTQMRLDEGFLGYQTKPVAEDMTVIGVGEIDGDPSIRPNFATNRSDAGDFSTKISRQLGITPEQRPWLFVVKKNKTVLKRLLHWMRHHVANLQEAETGRKIVTHLPLLLIDDEADHASVDTGEVLFDADGQPDKEHEPTAINGLVRQILHTFTRSAYVGYTATPFANIFIHERGETVEEGPDLFPSAFIVNLAAPSNYIGPARLFGHAPDDVRIGALPLTHSVSDHADADGRNGWMPQGHKNTHIPLHNGQDLLPPSLSEAINAFFLSCAVRRLRGQGNEHCSMLVHVTRFNAVQRCVHAQIDEYVRHIKQRLTRRIGDGDILTELKDLWDRDFVPSSAAVKKQLPDEVVDDLPEWGVVAAILKEVVPDIHVRMINGTAKDVLDYEEQKATGLKVIAVGGDKLARGLTLEGLSVSYFLRASRMYDTLMQMGRWFGYRPGYLDLCRLYTTHDLIEWFEHITDASEELRQEFDYMAATGGTPRDFGLKVQSHPVLMVTSRLKMRTARTLRLSFSGQLLETVALYRDPDILARNLMRTEQFVAKLGAGETNPERIRNGKTSRWDGYLWRNVGAADVIDYLNGYRTHPEAHKVNSLLISQFIQSMNAHGELVNWTVALIGSGGGKSRGRPLVLSEDVSVNMLERSGDTGQKDRYSIGRLMSPRDESIDLDERAWNAALADTRQSWKPDPARFPAASPPDVPNGPAIRRVRGFGAPGVPSSADRGLLFLYALDPLWAGIDFTADTPAIISLGISFPQSSSGVKVDYKVNNVLWEQEYGASE
jgi:hypothetical protein